VVKTAGVGEAGVVTPDISQDPGPQTGCRARGSSAGSRRPGAEGAPLPPQRGRGFFDGHVTR
jgi:hypothetical protein